MCLTDQERDAQHRVDEQQRAFIHEKFVEATRSAWADFDPEHYEDAIDEYLHTRYPSDGSWFTSARCWIISPPRDIWRQGGMLREEMMLW